MTKKRCVCGHLRGAHPWTGSSAKSIYQGACARCDCSRYKAAPAPVLT